MVCCYKRKLQKGVKTRKRSIINGINKHIAWWCQHVEECMYYGCGLLLFYLCMDLVSVTVNDRATTQYISFKKMLLSNLFFKKGQKHIKLITSLKSAFRMWVCLSVSTLRWTFVGCTHLCHPGSRPCATPHRISGMDTVMDGWYLGHVSSQASNRT